MTWLLIIGMSVITFANRYAFFVKALGYLPSENMRRFLSYSSYAILTSIWTPILFEFDYQAGFSHAGWDYLLAGTVAASLSLMRVRAIVVVVLSAAIFFGLRFFML